MRLPVLCRLPPRSVLCRRLVGGAALTLVLAWLQAQDGASPLDRLPANVRQIMAFGERAVWSPDGSAVAFVHKTLGDQIREDEPVHLPGIEKRPVLSAMSEAVIATSLPASRNLRALARPAARVRRARASTSSGA